MSAIPKGLGPYRRCKQCERSYRDRGPGSGVKRSVCSVECEAAEKRSKAQASHERSNIRKVTARSGRQRDPLEGVHGVYEFPIPFGFDPHHWVQQGWLKLYVRDLDLPDDEAVALLRDLLSDERNISVLEHALHWDGHYNPRCLFTRADVKPEAFEFAEELGTAMVNKLERAYPPATQKEAA